VKHVNEMNVHISELNHLTGEYSVMKGQISWYRSWNQECCRVDL